MTLPATWFIVQAIVWDSVNRITMWADDMFSLAHDNLLLNVIDVYIWLIIHYQRVF